MPDEPSITCPRCGRTSFNPNDVAHRYCGHCHEFHYMMGFKVPRAVAYCRVATEAQADAPASKPPAPER